MFTVMFVAVSAARGDCFENLCMYCMCICIALIQGRMCWFYTEGMSSQDVALLFACSVCLHLSINTG